MDKRQEARELWEQSGGTLPLKEIAARLGVSDATVRKWKQRDGWGEKCHVTDKVSRDKETSRKRTARTNARMANALEAVETLSDVEKDFCLHYVQCYNATQAAWRTGAYSTYGSAKQNGWRMLQKPAVQTEIKRLKLMKRASILADADDLIELHMRIAFADIKDYMAWVYDKHRKATRAAAFPSTDVDGQLVQEIAETEHGFRLRLYDKKDSLAFLEQYFLLNPMHRHKKAFDEAKLKLEERSVKVQEDKLHGLTSDVETIKEGLKGIIDVINAPVPDRRLDDE